MFKLLSVFVIFLTCAAVAEVGAWIGMKSIGILPSSDYLTSYRQSNGVRVAGLDMTRYWKSGFKRYPLFGFVYRNANNYGFLNSDDFPRAKKTDEFVIGVLGGSVASDLGGYLQRSPGFVQELKSGIPALRNKKIVLLNLAVAGYKQPQQFFVLSYFIEALDAIIQVDGWNEAWISGSGAYPIDAPAFSEVFYSNDAAVDQTLSRLSALETGIRGASGFLSEHPWLAKSSTFYLILYSAKKYLQSEAAELSDLQSRFGLQGSFYPSKLSPQRESELRVESWAKYLRFENELARSAGLKRFFFVQPSQYSPGAKVLTEKEKSVAIAASNRDAAATFAVLRKKAAELGREIPIYDLNGSFSNETRDIFMDDCCHVNSLGNELMAKRIAEVLSRKWERTSDKKYYVK